MMEKEQLVGIPMEPFNAIDGDYEKEKWTLPTDKCNEKAWNLSKPTKPLIPNFNTLSTILDRLIVENVKLSHFEYQMQETDNPIESARLSRSIEAQQAIIPALRDELSKAMAEIFDSGNYETIEEKRTFV